MDHLKVEDPLLTESAETLRDWLISYYCRGFSGLPSEERDDISTKAGLMARKLIHDALKRLNKPLDEALLDDTIYPELTANLPLDITISLNGVAASIERPAPVLRAEELLKAEMRGMAARLREIAVGSNMEEWIRLQADHIQSIAEAYKRL